VKHKLRPPHCVVAHVFVPQVAVQELDLTQNGREVLCVSRGEVIDYAQAVPQRE
jgi:hypothetical protein